MSDMLQVTDHILPPAGRRGSKNEFVQFLYISLGSLSELETQVIIANRLGYLILIDPNNLLESIMVIRKLINGLIYSLKRREK